MLLYLLLYKFKYWLYYEFRKHIKKLRRRANLSQQELAKLIGVNQYNISFWEINRSEPSSSQLLKLSLIFKVPVDYILGKNEIVTYNEEEFKSVTNNFELDIKDDNLKELLDIYNSLSKDKQEDLLQLIKSFSNLIK